MRRLVEASRVRILRLSVAGPGGLVESRPELHMELVMTTRGCSWIPLATRRLIPSWRSPHRTPRIATLMRQSPSRSNLPTPAWWILDRIALGAPTPQRVVVAPDLDERERLCGAAQCHAPTDRCAALGRRALTASRRGRHSGRAHALTTPAPATSPYLCAELGQLQPPRQGRITFDSVFPDDCPPLHPALVARDTHRMEGAADGRSPRRTRALQHDQRHRSRVHSS